MVEYVLQPGGADEITIPEGVNVNIERAK